MKRAIIVTGVPRSGTSLMCAALERLGVSFGEPLIHGDKANPWGYYEHETLVGLMALIVHDWCKPKTWFHDGPMTMRHVANANRDAMRKLLKEQKDLFGWKTPYAQRLPEFFETLLGEADYEVSYVHAVREPDDVYWSTLNANDTYHKNSTETYHYFLAVWARMFGEARALEPAAEVWFSDWNKPQETLDRLADSLDLCHGDATELVKEP